MVHEYPAEPTVRKSQRFHQTDQMGFLENDDQQCGNHIDNSHDHHQCQYHLGIGVQQIQPLKNLGKPFAEIDGDLAYRQQRLNVIRHGTDFSKVVNRQLIAARFIGGPAIEPSNQRQCTDHIRLIQLSGAGIENPPDGKLARSDLILDEVQNKMIPDTELETIGRVGRNQHLGISRRGIRKIQNGTSGKIVLEEGLVIIPINPLKYHAFYLAIDIDNPRFGSKAPDTVHPVDCEKRIQLGLVQDDWFLFPFIIGTNPCDGDVSEKSTLLTTDFLFEAVQNGYGQNHGRHADGHCGDCHPHDQPGECPLPASGNPLRQIVGKIQAFQYNLYLRKGKNFLDMRIVFMGTPAFAVASLSALIEAGKQVVAVITSPDRPAGRGQKLQQSPVKVFAMEHGIPVMQPEKLKDPAFLEELRGYQADLQVVVAFRMLPEQVWNMPPRGTLNLHASLLPQYRGAAPINHAIMNGESETGVTTFLLQHEIDTGDILFAEKTRIGPEENAGELHDRLMNTGAALVVKTVRAIADGTATPKSQDLSAVRGSLRSAPKIFREDTRIDWDQPVEVIHNRIRGLSPYPAAFTTLYDKSIKIYRAEKIPVASGTILPNAGTVVTDGKTFLRFVAADGFIDIMELQAEGKRRMEVVEFLRGLR